jgi:hypothetical protein
MGFFSGARRRDAVASEVLGRTWDNSRERDMSKTTLTGLVGGILIAVTVFLNGNTITFSWDEIKDTPSLVLFVAGVAVIAFALLRNRVMTGYAAMVGFTIALIWVVDDLRGDGLDITAKLVVLVVGVILALMASSVGKKLT